MEEVTVKNKIINNDKDNTGKVHSWRLCPIGMHYVKEHQEHIPPCKKNPEGEMIIRHAHCARNPLHKNHQRTIKDILSFDELQMISKTNFQGLKGGPKANVLDYTRADDFDELIRGWAIYWNAVFKATDFLDPNLVKALIASESSFNPDAVNHKNTSKIGPARGLMQLTDYTLRILHGQVDELKDNFVHLSHVEAMIPSANICAGTRWLFQKKAGAKERYARLNLDHVVTWDDAVAEYKGVLSGILDKNNKHPDPENKMHNFRSIYEKFQE